MRLRQRIARPVVAEAEHVSARKESAAPVAGAFLIVTFPVIISSFNFSHRDTETQRQEKGETEDRRDGETER